jgi:TP901 family phage tail tape measure protein
MPARNEIEIIIQSDDKASSVLNKLINNLDNAGTKMTKAGMAMTAATLPLAGALGVSVKSAMDFDEAMTNVGAVLGRSRSDMVELNRQVLAIGAASRAGPQAAAEAFYDIVGGVADASAHMAILESSIQTAEAGSADLGATTGALIAIMNSYGYSADQAAFASDVLTRTVGAGVGTMDQFASALPAVTGLANSMGIAFEDVAAATAYLTTQGNTASQSTTQLGGMMSALLNPSTSMREALEELGFESGRAAVEQLGLVGTYQSLIDTFGIDAIGPLVGQMEAMRGITALTDERFTTFSTNFVSGVEGATTAAQSIQLDSAAAQFDLLKSRMSELGITAGTALLPALNDIVTGLQPVIQGVVDWANKNPQAFQTVMLVAGGAVILGPILAGIGTVLSTVSAVMGAVTTAGGLLSGGFGLLGMAGTGLMTVVGGAGAALTAVLGPIGAAVVAIGGLAVALVGVLNQWNEFNRVVGEAQSYAQKEVQPLLASGQINRQDVYDQSFKSVSGQFGGGIVGDVAARLFYTNVGNSVMGDGSTMGRSTGAGLSGLPGREGGGPVTGGRPYIVGEAGPEVIVPRQSGTVVPNNAMGGQTIINVQAPAAALENPAAAESNGRIFGQAIAEEFNRRG